VVKKRLPAKNKQTTSKSSKVYNNISMATDEIYQTVLKSIVSSLVQHCPREILIEISRFISTIYPKLKDLCLNSIMENDTVKRREIAWKNVTSRILDVLHPLIQLSTSEQKPLIQVPNNTIEEMQSDPIPLESSSPAHKIVNSASKTPKVSPALSQAIKAYQKKNERILEGSCQTERIYWPKPLEINFLQIRDADDVATITCNVGNKIIPYAMIDSGSDSSVLSENIAEYLGQKINRKKIHNLKGVASKSLSLGTIANLPVTISDGNESATIMDEFSVIPTEKDHNGKELSTFILGTQWQYRAGWEPLVKGEFKAMCDGKTIIIPLSVHKAERNIFTIERDPEPIKKN
jgi:hypothetical protein